MMAFLVKIVADSSSTTSASVKVTSGGCFAFSTTFVPWHHVVNIMANKGKGRFHVVGCPSGLRIVQCRYMVSIEIVTALIARTGIGIRAGCTKATKGSRMSATLVAGVAIGIDAPTLGCYQEIPGQFGGLFWRFKIDLTGTLGQAVDPIQSLLLLFGRPSFALFTRTGFGRLSFVGDWLSSVFLFRFSSSATAGWLVVLGTDLGRYVPLTVGIGAAVKAGRVGIAFRHNGKDFVVDIEWWGLDL